MTLEEFTEALKTFRDSGDDKKARAAACVVAGAVLRIVDGLAEKTVGKTEEE